MLQNDLRGVRVGGGKNNKENRLIRLKLQLASEKGLVRRMEEKRRGENRGKDRRERRMTHILESSVLTNPEDLFLDGGRIAEKRG